MTHTIRFLTGPEFLSFPATAGTYMPIAEIRPYIESTRQIYHYSNMIAKYWCINFILRLGC
jgi:hypothetical protein